VGVFLLGPLEVLGGVQVVALVEPVEVEGGVQKPGFCAVGVIRSHYLLLLTVQLVVSVAGHPLLVEYLVPGVEPLLFLKEEALDLFGDGFWAFPHVGQRHVMILLRVVLLLEGLRRAPPLQHILAHLLSSLHALSAPLHIFAPLLLLVLQSSPNLRLLSLNSQPRFLPRFGQARLIDELLLPDLDDDVVVEPSLFEALAGDVYLS
jgi:hypothetical protein